MAKPMTTTCSRGVAIMMAGASKNALADVVLDLVRLTEGDESLEGRALALVAARLMNPRLKVRGDHPVNVDAWPALLERQVADGDFSRDQVDPLIEAWRHPLNATATLR